MWEDDAESARNGFTVNSFTFSQSLQEHIGTNFAQTKKSHTQLKKNNAFLPRQAP
jgi:hypothetical protein